MNSCWLIYHPRRVVSRFGGVTVHHDALSGNQDPYVWNARFLHTACHMTQMKDPRIGDFEVWVSGDTFPAFTQLRCDLVFVVEQKVYWEDANWIAPDDAVVDSPEAFADHYEWMPVQHYYRRRCRFTLKADPTASFQPQRHDGTLLDVVPVLAELGLSLAHLVRGLRAGWGSRPMLLPDGGAERLHDWLWCTADRRIAGSQLEAIRRSDTWPPRRRESGHSRRDPSLELGGH